MTENNLPSEKWESRHGIKGRTILIVTAMQIVSVNILFGYAVVTEPGLEWWIKVVMLSLLSFICVAESYGVTYKKDWANALSRTYLGAFAMIAPLAFLSPYLYVKLTATEQAMTLLFLAIAEITWMYSFWRIGPTKSRIGDP